MSSPVRGAARHVCANHPDRPAHAVCMACRKAVCGECATEWDGINYCVSCLAAQRRAGRGTRSTLGALSLALASVLLFGAAVRLMVWLGVLMAAL
jgi:B-box zinc finger protein